MANINEFKILNAKSKAYYEMLEAELKTGVTIISEKQKERFGFYLFMLESLCNIKDIYDLVELITDQEFNSTLFNKRDQDCGVDAVFIDDDENYINLFNFKFREKFNSDKEQSINDSFLTTKFVNAIITEDTRGLSGKLKKFSDDIILKFNSNDIWKFRFYIVSNESKELDSNIPELRQLRDVYDLEVTAIGLDSISKIMSLRPDPINAVIHVEKDSILPFVENSLSSSKSYIIRIPASDLIRITCNDSQHRTNYKMEDFSVLSNCEMEYNLLFDNVRGFIGRSKFNDNIFKTLKEEPSKLFMYNNGLTLTANDIISEDTNAHKKVKITIKDFQIVNGGQTLRTLHNFKQQDKDNLEKYLSDCELLLRVFKTSSESRIRNKIAEYTNSQNAISSIDLKALSSEQIHIEQYLDEHDIIYARKVGDTGLSSTKKYLHKISMEKFGQILFAIQGSPEKASNQKKHIFEKYYNVVFNGAKFDISKSVEHVKRYFEIKKEYEATGIAEGSDQKIFFILYIDQLIELPIQTKISLLDDTLQKFNPIDKKLNDVRKLLQVKFREFLTDEITALRAKLERKGDGSIFNMHPKPIALHTGMKGD